jgi:hypothetical protein
MFPITKTIIFVAITILLGMKVSSVRAEIPTPIFEESFESLDEITANGGTYSGITLEPGKINNSAFITGSNFLTYPVQNHFNPQKGTIEFWVKPNWDGHNIFSKPKYFITLPWGSTQFLFLPVYQSSSANYFFPSFSGTGIPANARVLTQEPYSIMKWKAGEWHKIQVYWDFTIPDDSDGIHHSYLIGKVDDKYTSFSTFPPITVEPITSNAKITIGGETFPGRYPADASFDELKIYDRSLLPVVPFPEYKFNPSDSSTIAAFRQLFANDGFCSPFENYNNMPADCAKLDDSIDPGKNILFYQKPTLGQVFENTIPKSEEIRNIMGYQAAQGQFADFFFNAYSRTDLNNVRVAVTDFSDPGGTTIPRDNLDLRVVKNWFQAGTGTGANQLPRYVPELMLYNDQISYEADTSLTNGASPSIPKQDHVDTKIDQNTSKQFVLISKVPDDALAGTYTATVTLSADGKSDQTITLGLEVLPFALKKTNKRLIASDWQMSAINWKGKTEQDFSNIYEKFNKELLNHGFNGVQTSTHLDYRYPQLGGGLDMLSTRLQVLQKIGFKNVILNDFWNPATFEQDIKPEYAQLMQQYGFEPWFYGVDEFSAGNVTDQINKNIFIHNIGGKSISTTFLEPSEVNAMSEPIDGIIYSNWKGSYLPDLMAGRVPKSQTIKESYYWQSEDEDPWQNRYNIGYLLWNTGLDGANPWNYIYTSLGTYYNDFNWKPYTSGQTPCCRSDTMAYPSQEGPVPTMEFEAMREGINDLNYLETWKYYHNIVAKNNLSEAQDSEIVVNDILAHYKDTGSSRTVSPAGFRVPMSQYEADRQTITAEILKLKAWADAHPATNRSDINQDSFVNVTDLGILMSDFLKTAASALNPRSDINSDGAVNVMDLGIMMSGWGK